jgi:signal transduction histidine kinase
MKILGEEFGRIGRWYIALPPLLLIGMLIMLFVLAAEGQLRLDAADVRVRSSEFREQALNELATLVTGAESERRGFLLTGEERYRKSYDAAAENIPPALERLRIAYHATPPLKGELAQLTALAANKQHQLPMVPGADGRLEQGPTTNVATSDAGSETTANILRLIAILRERESVDLLAATAQWQSDLQLSRWITTGGAMLNIGLVILATTLVYGDMRRRARQATDLNDQRQYLANQVEERTRELTALSTHLQGVSEKEKSALSRELHDELGGLLVAARMDLSWLQQRLPTSDPAIEQRFKRIHEYLSAGVDLKRRVVEELRPTLLDNMGLFTALRWQFKESCRRNGLICTESIPELELQFAANAAIGVFRVAQEAMTNILKHADARCADITIEVHDDTFVLHVSDDGKGILPNRLQTITSHGLGSMKHRVAALGGTWDVKAPPSGGTIVTARIPMKSMLMPEAPRTDYA